MALSEARKRANKKWNDANMRERYDRIQIVVPKGKKEIIQLKAKENGISVNAYINRAIDLLMNSGGGYGNSSAEIDTNSISRSVSHAAPTNQNQPHHERNSFSELEEERKSYEGITKGEETHDNKEEYYSTDNEPF